MANSNYPSFGVDAINQALEAAQRHSAARRPSLVNHETLLEDGALKLSAQCISVTVQNGQVCLNLPFGIGERLSPHSGDISQRHGGPSLSRHLHKMGHPLRC